MSDRLEPATRKGGTLRKTAAFYRFCDGLGRASEKAPEDWRSPKAGAPTTALANAKRLEKAPEDWRSPKAGAPTTVLANAKRLGLRQSSGALGDAGSSTLKQQKTNVFQNLANLKYSGLLLLAASGLFVLNASAALSLTESPGADDFLISGHSQTAAIFVAPSETPAVFRAAGDLVDDIARVTGSKPQLVRQLPADRTPVIIIGTIGTNDVVDRLAAAGKLNAQGIRGEWESYILQTLKDATPGAGNALVIAGSDRRGTIFGIYELSETIGVSPWYWWADVPPKQHSVLAIRSGIRRQGPPAVKYRGIFLNDEDWGLRPWASKTFEPETGNIGPKTYSKVFELLLRLRANYLWPAMHPDTPAFNSFPTNKEIADRYAIVMGSSHCEQMLRDNVDEWHRDGHGDYNYVSNREGVLKYWEQRVQENGRYENIYTVGMRGIHDSGMPGGGTEREKAARLQQIIKDQRDLLRRWVNPDVSRVPQIFCPYKEVLGLYRLAPDVPDDITLVWPDDNYGYVRQFSNAREQQRSGAAGVYYHISYYGRPYDYLWLNTTPPALIWEEMTKAFDYGASNVWVLNVGDLKPGEIGIEFFLRLGWNPHQWNSENVNSFLEEMAARDFGQAHAREIGEILAEYYRLNFQRKPEHMGIDPKSPLLAKPVFSPELNDDEVDHRLAAFDHLVERAKAVGKQLPSTMQDSYFQLVLYPVRASALMNAKGLNLARCYAWSAQGRPVSAVRALESARQAYVEIQKETAAYNSLAGGKWRNMMSANPRKLGTFDMPKPLPQSIPEAAVLGVAAEGSAEASLANSTNVSVQLPEFNKLLLQSHFVDVFSSGSNTLHWSATASADWIKLNPNSGDTDARMTVSVDWNRAPAGNDVRGTIRISGAGQEIPVELSLFNPANTDAVRAADFVENNRRIVMDASHATAMVPGSDSAWKVIRGLGYKGDAVSAFPVTVPVRAEPTLIKAESPCLQYRVWIRTPGDWKFIVRALPTWSIESGKPQRYAIACDNEPPKVVSLPAGRSEEDRVWQENVLRNAALSASTHTLSSPGVHTVNIWIVDPGIVVDTIFAENNPNQALGYLGPQETRLSGSK